jgi:pyruvate dehydrogenase E1 component alpha subunit
MQDTCIGEYDSDFLLDLLERIVRIREFEEGVIEQLNEGGIPGFVHLSHGHEGSHAGMGEAMADDDWLAVGGSRLHGQYLTKGMEMREVMAEIFGKETGPNSGKGGHPHLMDPDRHLYGHAATIGSGQNPAAGIALAQKLRETGNIVVSVIGDGGTNRGSFHTALVLAATWDLPIVYVIENNSLAISYDSENIPTQKLSKYGEPLEIPNESIDGVDPVAVYETVSDAIDRARSGNGPTLVESNVSRLRGHFEGDKQQYRADDEYDQVKAERDPLPQFRDRLLKADVIDEDHYEDIRSTVSEDVEAAIEFAEESEFPDSEDAYDDVYNTPLYGQGGD